MVRGLAALHHECEKPIRHMDIKPENILLVEGFCDAKLADYGVAKEQESSSTPSSSYGVGTQAYICPVAMETAVQTIVSDVYSLGLVLLQMLLG